MTIVPPSRKTLPFLKDHKNKIIPFLHYLAHFAKNVLSIGTAKITHKESFKDKDYPIAT